MTPYLIPLAVSPSSPSPQNHGYIATYYQGILSGFVKIYDFEIKEVNEDLLEGFVGVALRNSLNEENKIIHCIYP